MIIKAQRGRGKKIHLLLNDEYIITTDSDLWAENYIVDGTDISDEEWERLVVKINYKKAFNKCVDLLSRRDHSVKELRDKLLRTVDEKSADKAIEKFMQLGYLDDEKFAVQLAEYLFKVKNFSVNHVKQELYKRGIDRNIIDNIIEENEVDPIDSIINVINKKYLNKLRADGGKEKVISALMLKGFKYSEIKTAFYRIENDEYV